MSMMWLLLLVAFLFGFCFGGVFGLWCFMPRREAKPEPAAHPERKHTEDCIASAIYGGYYNCARNCPLVEPATQPHSDGGPYR